MSAVVCPDDTVAGIKIMVIDDGSSDPIVNAEVENKKKYGTEMTKSAKRTVANSDVLFFPLSHEEYDYKVIIDNNATAKGSIAAVANQMTMVTLRLRRN